MKYMIGTGYAARPDLLYRAMYSIKPYWSSTVIIDNSESDFLTKEPFGADSVTIYTPPVPLRYPQMMNLMQKFGMEAGCDIILFMHSDAEIHPGTMDQLLSKVELLNRHNVRWGAAFTNYDVLVAYPMEAIREIGPWDTVFYDYHSDMDYYRRLQLAEYELIYTNLGVTHLGGGSNTGKSSRFLQHLTFEVTFPLFLTYYEKKWGGPIGKELYDKPFDKFPLNPKKARW
ncbi:glycosyltransferase family 2 protein [Paenibacillus sp. y28]|uniref:glycosyltransferase family 2 protein n=1 Tax=Paenibacillus sp. y28 TaxID=3129110 RepID=UPI003017544D